MFIKYDTCQVTEKSNELILSGMIKNQTNINTLIFIKNKLSKKYFKEIMSELLSLSLNNIKDLTLESIKILLNNNKKHTISILKKYYGEFVDENILNELSNSPNDIIKACIAANKNCSANILIKLYNNKNKQVKKEAYTNIKSRLDDTRFINSLLSLDDVPSSILKLMYLRYKGEVSAIYSVIVHPNFPVELLEKLSTGDDNIKTAVAENVNCPISILEKLSGDDSWRVRDSVVDNINCPISILKNLSNDNVDSIRKICDEKLKIINKN